MDRRRLLRAFELLVSAAVVMIWALALRPQALGGSAGYVMVRGISMTPTYHTGDLVVTRSRPAYRPGDIVAYRVPSGQIGAGAIVIHRVTGGSAAGGYVVKGDHNPEPDPWHPTAHDVIGRAWFLAPRAGTIFAFLHAPLPLASLAAGLAVAMIVVPSARPGREPAGAGRFSGGAYRGGPPQRSPK